MTNTNTNEDIIDWNPRATYVWTKQQIEKWLDVFGTWGFFAGRRYTIQPKKIFGNRYEVKFKDIDA